MRFRASLCDVCDAVVACVVRMSTCHKGLRSYGLVMGQTGGVGYAGSWWLGGSLLLWAWIWGFSPAQPPSSITSCEGVGLPAHISGNHTAEAVASPRWTKRRGRQHRSLEVG